MLYGFLGVGRMGGGLARNLLRAGKQVLLHDLSPEAVETALAAGTTGRAASDVRELAAVDVLFTSLPRPSDLEAMMLGEDGARSFQMDVRGPWIAAGDFASRFGLDLALKDVRLGCEMARSWGTDASIMKATLGHFEEASAEGLGGEDCNAVYKVIE